MGLDLIGLKHAARRLGIAIHLELFSLGFRVCRPRTAINRRAKLTKAAEAAYETCQPASAGFVHSARRFTVGRGVYQIGNRIQ